MRRIRSLLLLLAWPLLAPAQLLPPLQPVLEPPLRSVLGGATGTTSRVLRPLTTEARQLLRRHPDFLETDRRGLPVMRSVVIALSPDPDALARALGRGYVVQEDRQLSGIGQRLVTLLVPRGTNTREALRQLREGDPRGEYDFDHLYFESAATPSAGMAQSGAAGDVAPLDIRVGLVDGGVDAAHPVFARRAPRLSGCGGASRPSPHGTAVASLFVGWSDVFTGAAPGAELVAVDVYCGSEGPGGRMRDVVGALSELADARVRVLNVSLVGPDNLVLAAAVRAVQQQSILVVAATGNDGPNAKPLYPAAYPGVVAVSAVDAKLRVLPEASGGTHVAFSAPGADLVAAVPGNQYQTVRGTSFAAPLVAGMLARALAQSGGAGEEALRQLAAQAEDRGSRGRDSRYGHGLVGADLPARNLMASPR